MFIVQDVTVNSHENYMHTEISYFTVYKLHMLTRGGCSALVDSKLY